jgi:hypothetical protein
MHQLEKFIFVNKNWPNDTRVGCEVPSSMIELIERWVHLEDQLNDFEGLFEQDELKED